MAKPKFNTSDDNITFNLVNEDAVKRLIRDKQIDLPPRKVAVPKDMRWNEKQMASKILQGIQNGSSIRDISKSLESVVDNNRTSAMRIARTMTTSAENHGRFDSYQNLTRQGVVMKKEWEATPDDRTRPSHIDIDGEEQDIDKVFSNGCMFPGDGRGPAEEVWNCRCAMGAHILGFKKADGSISKVNHGRDSGLHQVQMAAQRAIRYGKGTAGSKTFADKINDIAEDIAENGLTEEKLIKAGRILADEINPILEAREAEYLRAKEEVDRLGRKEIDELIESQMHKDAISINRGLMYTTESEYWKDKTWDDVYNYLKEKYDWMQSIEQSKVYKDALRAEEVARKAVNGTFSENIKLMRDKLSEVREVGTASIDKNIIRAHFKHSRSSIRTNIEEAYNCYPTAWVKASMQHSDINVKKVSRGYYQHFSNTIAISGSGNSATTTSIHELGHRFERTILGVRDSEKAFYDRRTAGEALEWLGSGYAKTEVTRKDNFLNAYMGKDYNETAYELVSMGFQYAYTDPVRLMKDKDMQAWIFGILCTL